MMPIHIVARCADVSALSVFVATQAGGRRPARRLPPRSPRRKFSSRIRAGRTRWNHIGRRRESDPGWFEAQYNYGVLAYRLRNYGAALAAYEMAVAIQPDSTDARYNFALALKAAGYVPDAVDELKKVVAASPNEVRAQLALGNLYAQQLHDPAQARRHYLKVLELDPHNPQSTDIRFWLSANPA